MSCTLHLNPADENTEQRQADDCDCYTKTECEEETSNQVLNEAVNDAVLVLGQTNYGRMTTAQALIMTPDGKLI